MLKPVVDAHARLTIKQGVPARTDYRDRSTHVKMISPLAWERNGS